jgi:hypothetical protein
LTRTALARHKASEMKPIILLRRSIRESKVK